MRYVPQKVNSQLFELASLRPFISFRHCRVEPKKRQNSSRAKYWEIIADNLSRAGWSWGCVSALDSEGRTIWIADAHRGDGTSESHWLGATSYSPSIDSQDCQHHEERARNKHLNAHVM